VAPPIELLRHVPLFSDLRKADLERVAEAFTERTFGTGDAITEQGTAGTSFFIVAGGHATVTVRDRPVGTLGPGDAFGEVGLVDREHIRSATVRANTDLHVFSVTFWDFEPLLDAYPSIARRLLELLAARLRDADNRDDPINPDLGDG